MPLIPIAIIVTFTIGALVIGSCHAAEDEYAPNLDKKVHDFTLTANDGTEYPLAQHKGQLILLVNTASRCGFTDQYSGLQELYQAYADQGLVVIALPSNDFMGQEPGTNEEIAAFCQTNFSITFPLMARSVVRGSDRIPLYDYLIKESHFPGKITWNFNKFLVGPDGYVIGRFGSRVKPESIKPTIEDALATLPKKETSEKESTESASQEMVDSKSE